MALGSDQAPGNNCHNIINEMKNVCLFNKIKYQNPEIMPAWKALRNGHDRRGQSNRSGGYGRLSGGRKAGGLYRHRLELSLYAPHLHIPHAEHGSQSGVQRPAAARWLWAAVDGEIIMQDGKFTRINAEDYLAAIPQYPDDIGRRAAKEFFEIDGTNAHFMREDKL